jgi:hypothetical protein
MHSGRAVPSGVYDVINNRGFVCVGTSGDTPAFAVDAISTWWQADGHTRFPGADHLLLLADAGGGNSCQTAELCVRVEGLPLSIELTAARGQPCSIRASYCHGWSLASRCSPAALLEAGDQRLFRRLSVFAGG